MKRLLAGLLAVGLLGGCGGSTSEDANKGGSGGSATAATGGSGGAATGGLGGSATGGVGGGATGGTGGTDPFQKFLGTWLIGWMGDMNHFSWVRLEAGGAARFLSGVNLSFNYPYWDCNGVGTWIITQQIDTVGLNFPSACGQGFEALTFSKIAPATGGYPKGALEHASIESTSTQSLEAYRFADTQCNADLTSCADPFK